jgi:hypothetical protein
VTTTATERRIDLRRAPLAELRAVDFRSTARDYWADEAALHERLVASWAGLDDAAWRLPGAAPSDAGGPDWSLLDHVGHLVDWWDLAVDYLQGVMDGRPWPSDDDFDGGDFDTFNERRRERFAMIPPAELRTRVTSSHARALAIARQLPEDTIRGDAAWGWVHLVLHGHAVDHLTVLEPWADQLRIRQIGNDPFGPDPQPTRATLAAAQAKFATDDATVDSAFRHTLASVPDADWTARTDADWTLADHVAHLTTWFHEGARALETHRATGDWIEMPAEGLDSFNARHVRAAQGTPLAALRAGYDAGLERIRAAVAAMTDTDWLDPEGFSWAYEDLHGHVRAHHAMIGPWAARVGWPPSERDASPRAG